MSKKNGEEKKDYQACFEDYRGKKIFLVSHPKHRSIKVCAPRSKFRYRRSRKILGCQMDKLFLLRLLRGIKMLSVELQNAAYNALPGTLNAKDGIDCPICNNKGVVYPPGKGGSAGVTV